MKERTFFLNEQDLRDYEAETGQQVESPIIRSPSEKNCRYCTKWHSEANGTYTIKSNHGAKINKYRVSRNLLCSQRYLSVGSVILSAAQRRVKLDDVATCRSCSGRGLFSQ